jgi:hypothetical protein
MSSGCLHQHFVSPGHLDRLQQIVLPLGALRALGVELGRGFSGVGL